jgi:hypothetical protein
VLSDMAERTREVEPTSCGGVRRECPVRGRALEHGIEHVAILSVVIFNCPLAPNLSKF